MTLAPPVATVLPPAARRLLQRAAQTPVTPADPLARIKAIEQAVEQIQRQYPEFFTKEQPS